MPHLRRLIYLLIQRVALLRYHSMYNIDVRVGAATVKIPVIEGQWPQYENYEPWLLTAIERIFARRPGAFIDVGANRGQTLIKVAAVDRTRRYIGFEPNLGCANFVERIIELNALSNHTIFPVGLADRSRAVQLLVSSTGSESSTTAAGVRGMAAYAGSKQVLVQTGDSILDDLALSEVALIKLDVEGAELEALLGLRRTIERHQPWLVFEVLPPSLVDKVEARVDASDRAAVTANNRRRAGALQDLLDQLGYSFRNIHGAGLLRPANTLDMGENADLSMSNFIAAPGAQAHWLDPMFA